MSLATILTSIRNHVAARTWAGKSMLEMGTQIATDLSTLEDYIDSEVTFKFIGSDDALTVDNDGNVAGLASAIVQANSLKATLNVHMAEATEHATGVQPAIAVADASDLASILALVNDLTTQYNVHDDDAILGAGWAYHIAQGTERALIADIAVTTLVAAIAQLVDLQDKINLHVVDAVSHTNEGTSVDASADAAMGVVVNIPLTGALAADKVVWSIIDSGTGTVTGVSLVAGTDILVATFSADPVADTIISYMVVRQG